VTGNVINVQVWEGASVEIVLAYFCVVGKRDAPNEGMSPRLQIVLHLASVIDLKREKLESALTEARRQQLAEQIDLLSKQFETEYVELMATDPREDEIVRTAVNPQFDSSQHGE
jgi:hypothetical protein